MEKNYGEKEIKDLLYKVQIFNKKMGMFQMFIINDNFDYIVKLSNGKLIIKEAEIEKDQEENLTPKELEKIASRFALNNPQESDVRIKVISKRKFKSILIILTIFCIVAIGLILLSSNIFNSYDSSADPYYSLQSIEDLERLDPVSYLSTDGSYKDNFWGNKIKLECIILNRATKTSYKDVVIGITYYSKTKTKIMTKEITIYEIFPANSTKKINLEIDKYKNVETIGWEVIYANPN